jgi:hypothetical protein
MVRIKGQGLIIQERPKTATGWRRLALPPYAAEIIMRRSHDTRRTGWCSDRRWATCAIRRTLPAICVRY